MKLSVTSLTLPGSDVPWLLNRACSGEWPYEPQWLEWIRHPSLAPRFRRSARMFVVDDMEPRTVQVGVEVIRRAAKIDFGEAEVKHFEVVPSLKRGWQTIPHDDCDTLGCSECDDLGHLFLPSAKDDDAAYLMGWLAVHRVA